MKNKNDCYTCPHRGELRGSAHSECKVFRGSAHSEGKVLTNGVIAFAFAMKVASGEITGMDNDKGEQVLKFDPHGVRSGWCTWPINFDPVWVDCYLPIESSDQ